jgi:hypothetical protein
MGGTGLGHAGGSDLNYLGIDIRWRRMSQEEGTMRAGPSGNVYACARPTIQPLILTRADQVID